MAFNQLVASKLAPLILRSSSATSIITTRALASCPPLNHGSKINFLQPSTAQHQQTRTMKRWKEKLLRQMYWRGRSFDKLPQEERPRSAWQDWDLSSELFAFARRLSEPQLSEEALMHAFTHRSYVSAQQAQQAQLGIANVQLDVQDNGRLIEEGRKMIEQHALPYLRYHLRSAPEECIQSIGEYLLSEEVLADIAKWTGCIDLVLCAEFPPSHATLADTVPALVATIAQHGGPERARLFISDFILTYLNGSDLLEIWPLHSFGIDLNQCLRSRGEPDCEPRLMYKSADTTLETCFVVGMFQKTADDGHKLVGQSPGESPSIALKMAELDVLRNLFGLTTGEVRFVFGQASAQLDLAPFARKENFRLFQDQRSSHASSREHQSSSN